METKILQALNINTSEVFSIELYFNENEETDEFVMSVEMPQIAILVKGEYCFNTFQEFRDKLLNYGIGLKCHGSLLNVCQSPMASYTENIYVITMGKQALMKDMVNMFEYIDIDIFPTTKEQNNFYQKWLASII
jgi:hypothetical protein